MTGIAWARGGAGVTTLVAEDAFEIIKVACEGTKVACEKTKDACEMTKIMTFVTKNTALFALGKGSAAWGAR